MQNRLSLAGISSHNNISVPGKMSSCIKMWSMHETRSYVAKRKIVQGYKWVSSNECKKKKKKKVPSRKNFLCLLDTLSGWYHLASSFIESVILASTSISHKRFRAVRIIIICFGFRWYKGVQDFNGRVSSRFNCFFGAWKKVSTYVLVILILYQNILVQIWGFSCKFCCLVHTLLVTCERLVKND